MITSCRQRDILNEWKVINKEMSGLWSLVIYDKRNTTNNLFSIYLIDIKNNKFGICLHDFVFHGWIGSSEYD
jgi:hypothetical protein